MRNYTSLLPSIDLTSSVATAHTLKTVLLLARVSLEHIRKIINKIQWLPQYILAFLEYRRDLKPPGLLFAASHLQCSDLRSLQAWSCKKEVIGFQPWKTCRSVYEPCEHFRLGKECSMKGPDAINTHLAPEDIKIDLGSCTTEVKYFRIPFQTSWYPSYIYFTQANPGIFNYLLSRWVFSWQYYTCRSLSLRMPAKVQAYNTALSYMSEVFIFTHSVVLI